MRVFPRLRFGRLLRYRLWVTGVAIVYLLVALEIPLPVFAHKETGQSFPCQDHPCGCESAEQCWRGCCCFTVEERWEWARAHNVEPPAYAEKPKETEDAAGWNTVKLRDRALRASEAKSCCSAKPERISCCRAAAKRSEKSPPTEGHIRWTTALKAWQCRGSSTLWISVGSVLPASPRAAWVFDEVPPTWMRPFSIRADKIASILLDPPPRMSAI